MDKRRMNHITAGFIVVMALVIAVMFGNNLRRPPHVVLPDPSDTGDQTEEEGAGSGSLALVEVTPETVQTAIATLDRPAQYRRSITIEQFWDGGSGTYEVNVLAYGRWTRTDRTMPDGRARHTITNGETTYIWYDGDREAFSAPAAGISADNEQTIPTYEDVLELPVEAIAQADYRVISEVSNISARSASSRDPGSASSRLRRPDPCSHGSWWLPAPPDRTSPRGCSRATPSCPSAGPLHLPASGSKHG